MSDLKRSNQELVNGNMAINRTLKELLQRRQSQPPADIEFGVPFMPRQSANANHGLNGGANRRNVEPMISIANLEQNG